MIATVRLKLPASREESSIMVEEAFNRALEIAGVRREEIWYTPPVGVGSNQNVMKETHIGYWCVVPILDNESAAKIIAANPATLLDLRRTAIEDSDLAKLVVGDKVAVRYISPIMSSECRTSGTIVTVGVKKVEDAPDLRWVRVNIPSVTKRQDHVINIMVGDEAYIKGMV